MKERHIELNGSVRFRDIMDMYRDIISIGIPTFNIYGFSSYDHENGIHMIGDFHHDNLDYLISISEDNKQFGLISTLNDTVERMRDDIKDSGSHDPIVAHSPEVRAHHELGMQDFDAIADNRVDWAIVYKQAEHVPLIGERYGIRLPFIKDRELLLQRHGESYNCRFRADTIDDLATIENMLYGIIRR